MSPAKAPKPKRQKRPKVPKPKRIYGYRPRKTAEEWRRLWGPRPLTVYLPNVARGSLTTNRNDLVVTNSKNGQSVKLFKEKIKRGLDASSPYTCDVCKVVKARPASFAFTSNVWQSTTKPNVLKPVLYEQFTFGGFYGNLTSRGTTMSQVLAHVVGVSSEIDNKAIARLHKKIRDDHSSVNGLLFLGELRETIGMLRHPFEAARKAVHTYCDTLKSKVKHVRQTVKPRRSDNAKSLRLRRLNALKDGMAGSWLELQFGIKPAISDAKDIVEGLDRVVEAHEKNLRFSGSAKGQVVAETLAAGKSVVKTGLLRTYEEFRNTTPSVRYVAIFRPTFGGSLDYRERLVETLGFSVENFVPTIYELIPWSFLIDYFVNLGGILEQATTSSSGLVTCVKSVKQITNYVQWEDFSGYSDGYFVGGVFAKELIPELGNSSYRSLIRTTLTRTVTNSLPIQSLTFSVPGYGSVKWANMTALLAQSRRIGRM